MTNGPAQTEPLVIGLAGGIGAGKSSVAAAFKRLGCVVIDSDAEAKAALDRPAVRDELVRWWGAGVLDSRGRIDRAAVAKRVFDAPDQRARLEALIHPLIRRTRAQAQAEARAAGAPAIIYDAPLLFEAGLDDRCDAVVFVDCPREERLRRLRVSRGWDEAEVSRREAAQIPAPEKRRRSGYVIDNRPESVAPAAATGGAALDAQTARLLAILLEHARAGLAGGRTPPETQDPAGH